MPIAVQQTEHLSGILVQDRDRSKAASVEERFAWRADGLVHSVTDLEKDTKHETFSHSPGFGLTELVIDSGLLKVAPFSLFYVMISDDDF